MEYIFKNLREQNIADTRFNNNIMIIFLLLFLLSACVSTSDPSAPQLSPKNLIIADLQIVDCLLPGQVRNLGNSIYVTPRRPLMTTAADCKIRGGEFVAYDRADYKSALNVWLASAEAGDLAAQTNVGEIFEKGTAGQPNYDAAIIWYTKAANAGYSRAQFNLATLYEQGLGVEKNTLTALNWYRKSWGLPENNLIYQSAAYKEQKKIRGQLQNEIESKAGQIKLLNKQIQQLKSLSKNKSKDENKVGNINGLNHYQTDIQQLSALVKSLKSEKNASEQKHLNLPIFREPKSLNTTEDTSRNSLINSDTDLQFGKYYALIIANQNYQTIGNLNTPHNDALQLSKILQNKYGFAVQTLLDANNIQVMQAINDLNSILTEKDNLLIFYAGHGTRLNTGDSENGYWLPINADPPPTDTYWVSNEFITRHLARLKAKRVLIVADSCYAGLLSNQGNNLLMGSKPKYTQEYLRYKLAKKSRFVLSSGGDKPVLDSGSNGNSIFATAFLDQLDKNEGIMASSDLFLTISAQVSKKAEAVGVTQIPQLNAIKGSNHEAGDFFFIPTSFYQTN